MQTNKPESVESLARSMGRLRDRLLKFAQSKGVKQTARQEEPKLSTLRPSAKASMSAEAARKATTPKVPARPPQRKPGAKPGQPRAQVPAHLKPYLFKPKAGKRS